MFCHWDQSHCRNPSYKLRGVTLETTADIRDLGFLISKDLSFDLHHKALAKKANYRIYNLFKALKSRDPQILLRAYKTYVRPMVECGTTVFNPSKRKNILLLENVQNSFTRKLMMRCYGNNYYQMPNGAERAEMLGLPSLFIRRKRADLLMMFKILTGRVSINPLNFFGTRLTRNIRGKLRLYVSVAKSRARASFFTYRNLKEFNHILSTNEEVLGLSLHGFKKLLLRMQ